MLVTVIGIRTHDLADSLSSLASNIDLQRSKPWITLPEGRLTFQLCVNIGGQGIVKTIYLESGQGPGEDD